MGFLVCKTTKTLSSLRCCSGVLCLQSFLLDYHYPKPYQIQSHKVSYPISLNRQPHHPDVESLDACNGDSQ